MCPRHQIRQRTVLGLGQAIAQVQERLTELSRSDLRTQASCSSSSKLLRNLAGSGCVKVAGGTCDSLPFFASLQIHRNGGLISPLSSWIAVVLSHLLSSRTAHDRERARAPTHARQCLAGGGCATQPAQSSVASAPGPRSASARTSGSQGVAPFVNNCLEKRSPLCRGVSWAR